MLTAHWQSMRVLRGVLGASAALPFILFTYASWQSYSTTRIAADRQIERSRDVINEHALKVFEAVDRSIAETNEIIRDLSDEQILERGQALHLRLKRLANDSAELKSLWIFDKTGHALVNSIEFPTPPIDFSDRDYFHVHVDREIGTFVGQVLRPRAPYGGAPFFGVSHRRTSADGRFTGVVQASVLPEYFEGFYAKIGQQSGSYYSLIREDGLLLARYPALAREAWLAPQGDLIKAMREQPQEGTVSLVSKIDDRERKVSYLKLPNLPLYVVAGLDASAVRAEWFSQVQGYLLFGLPMTAALLLAIALALRRTRHLYEEARRRQQAEEALKQSQRLEALGQLTGGVAHDFNNILMVVGGSARRLRRSQTEPREVRALEMIELAVQKGESLTRKLLSFSRRRTLSPKVVDLTASVSSLRGVLAQSVQGDIAFDFKLPREVIAVKVDPSELEIALINLTLNARDAMPDGGTITIAVAHIRTNEREVSTSLRGEIAILTVRDTGTGIPDEIRSHIFEPFFTTKPVDKGTGLGLSQVYGFVTQSGGTVSVESESGGATFTLHLPLSDELPEDIPPQAPEHAHDFKRSRVLLVEDNPDVAVVATDYLEQCGCSVTSVASAEDAIAALNGTKTIDLVFSDIVMPGMSGLELGRLIRDHHPDIPVVLTSGYSDKAALAVQEGFTLLEKPYALEALHEALTRVLFEQTRRRSVDARE